MLPTWGLRWRMLALIAAIITIKKAYAVDIMETDILTLQHDSARAQRHIKEQLDGLNRAERNIAQLVEEVVGLRGEVRRLQSLEKEVRELRALLGTRRPEPGVLYELPAGHEREVTVTVTTAGDQPDEAQIATRAAVS